MIPEFTPDYSTTVVSFFPLPMAEKEHRADDFRQTLLFLLQQTQQNRIQSIHRKIGDGVNKIFGVELPFNLISWRITNKNNDIIEPDIQVKSRVLTIIFGITPMSDEFEIEILGVSN
jgi:hypothetical protein